MCQIEKKLCSIARDYLDNVSDDDREFVKEIEQKQQAARTLSLLRKQSKDKETPSVVLDKLPGREASARSSEAWDGSYCSVCSDDETGSTAGMDSDLDSAATSDNEEWDPDIHSEIYEPDDSSEIDEDDIDFVT